MYIKPIIKNFVNKRFSTANTPHQYTTAPTQRARKRAHKHKKHKKHTSS